MKFTSNDRPVPNQLICYNPSLKGFPKDHKFEFPAFFINNTEVMEENVNHTHAKLFGEMINFNNDYYNFQVYKFGNLSLAMIKSETEWSGNVVATEGAYIFKGLGIQLSDFIGWIVKTSALEDINQVSYCVIGIANVKMASSLTTQTSLTTVALTTDSTTTTSSDPTTTSSDSTTTTTSTDSTTTTTSTDSTTTTTSTDSTTTTTSTDSIPVTTNTLTNETGLEETPQSSVSSKTEYSKTGLIIGIILAVFVLIGFVVYVWKTQIIKKYKPLNNEKRIYGQF